MGDNDKKKIKYEIGDEFDALSGHQVELIGVDDSGQLIWERTVPDNRPSQDKD